VDQLNNSINKNSYSVGVFVTRDKVQLSWHTQVCERIILDVKTNLLKV